ncbi:MAG: DUF4115 domain-containing protein, partial [Desulfobacterota bacterium]|nr:DUF4115 domain-containing protein [Thermodesulfobacteriota bacterium]
SLIPQHKKTTSQETKTTEKVQPPGDKILSNQEVISPAEESLSEKEPLNLRDILPPTDSYLSEQKGIISVSPSVPPPLPILMKATCYATTWIGYVIDNGQPSQMFLYPGDEFSCEGRERIELKIGNAGGIKITVNGIPLKIIGKSGEVVKVIFTKEFLIINNGEPQKLELWREGNQTQLEESE